jgi:hypothetical protein
LYVSAQPEINYSWGKIKQDGEEDIKLDGKWLPACLVGAGAVLSPNGKGGMFIGIQYNLIQYKGDDIYRSPYGTHPYINIGFGF